MSSFYNSRRFGRFIIDINNIRNNRDMVQNIMALVIPVQAQVHSKEDSIEYLAISNKFEDLPEGKLVPLYNFQMDGNGNFQKVIQMPPDISNGEDVMDDIFVLVEEHNVNTTDFRNWAVMKGISDNGLRKRNVEYLEFLQLYVDKIKK